MSELNIHADARQASAMALKGPHPRDISAWLLRFLMWKFWDVRHLRDSALHDPKFIWRPDDSVGQNMDKGILITTAGQYSPQDALQRPALVLKRGPQTPVHALGGIYGGRDTPGLLPLGDVDANRTPTAGLESQSVFLQGSHTCFAIATLEAQADLLAIEVWMELLARVNQIRSDCRLKAFQVGQVSAVQRLLEYRENWVSAIMVSYSYQVTYLQGLESPILSGFDMEPAATVFDDR